MKLSPQLKWIVVLTLIGLLAVVAGAGAQQQQQGQGGNAQAPGFAGRGGMARGNLVMGTISEVDAANKSFAIKTREGEVWVIVADATQMTRISKAAAADLQLGMNVVVRGRPTEITAVTLGLGEELPAPPQRPQRPQGGGVAPAAGAAGPVPNANPDAAAPPAGGFPPAANAARGAITVIGGKITKLDPLTVTTADGNDILVNLPADAALTTTADVTLADLKPEENVVIMGQRNDDGTYNAGIVRLGEPGLGMRGFGGQGGQGRQGRQGRGGNGAAGQGAARPGHAATPAAVVPHAETEA